MRMATGDGHLIQTVFFFVTECPSDDAIAQANIVLESLTIRQSAEAGFGKPQNGGRFAWLRHRAH